LIEKFFELATAMRRSDAPRVMRACSAGVVPWWWQKPLKQLPASFNARAETIADKPMFRDAFKRHRCVISAGGYYEWLKKPCWQAALFHQRSGRKCPEFRWPVGQVEESGDGRARDFRARSSSLMRMS